MSFPGYMCVYSILNFLANSMKAFIGRLHLAGAFSPFAGLAFRRLFGLWRGEWEGLGAPAGFKEGGGVGFRFWLSLRSKFRAPGDALLSGGAAPPPDREACRRFAMLLRT